MGWWKISSPEEGGIDWDFAGVGPGSLVNAIPGKDHSEIYYNGDSVADIMDGLIRRVRDNWPNITREEFEQAYSNLDLSNSELMAFIQKAKELIIKEYQEAWGRDPYPEEWQAIASFCSSIWS
jgi:hypothetical protein